MILIESRLTVCFWLFVIIGSLCSISCNSSAVVQQYDVVVIGEGTGAVTAAIQSARSGAHTLYINPLPWAGGMLSSAGVSATDGNHQLHSGLWTQWREMIRSHYGGMDSIFTGWVSHTMFEPSVGAYYFDLLMADEELLDMMTLAKWSTITKSRKRWHIYLSGSDRVIESKILIDGTDLGDVAAQVGVTYDIGMDSRYDTGETIAPEKSNDMIQDLTYVAILKSFPGEDRTIDQPIGYDPQIYHCACNQFCDELGRHDCAHMLDYGKLPNDKYMINWPMHGNDYYANTIELSYSARNEIYERAKQHTLGFVYYIQHELGYSHLGLSSEFPSDDKLPLIPYHREGRRINGLVRFTLSHMTSPYGSDLYRTGVAVGDYPIDHHHYKNEAAPVLDFPQIPSFSIPLGSLIPRDIEDLIMADKAISVSNIANGATRLQPVVMQIGQAAGLLAALSIEEEVSPHKVPVRLVQNELIKENVYLFPFIDVEPSDPYFSAVQRIAATGLLRGTGIPYKWANQTWFYPDSLVVVDSLIAHSQSIDSSFTHVALSGQYLTVSDAKTFINEWRRHMNLQYAHIDTPIEDDVLLKRADFALLLDQYLDPFHIWQIDHQGHIIYNSK